MQRNPLPAMFYSVPLSGPPGPADADVVHSPRPPPLPPEHRRDIVATSAPARTADDASVVEGVVWLVAVVRKQAEVGGVGGGRRLREHRQRQYEGGKNRCGFWRLEVYKTDGSAVLDVFRRSSLRIHRLILLPSLPPVITSTPSCTAPGSTTQAMADASPPPSAVPSGGFSSGFRITDPAATLGMLPAPVPYVLAAALAMLFLFSQMSSKSKLPHLNPQKPLEFTETRCKKDFVANSRAMLDGWFNRHSDKAARIISDAGEVIVLPPGLAHEMRNDKRLSFAGWVVKVGNSLPMHAQSVCTWPANTNGMLL